MARDGGGGFGIGCLIAMIVTAALCGCGGLLFALLLTGRPEVNLPSDKGPDPSHADPTILEAEVDLDKTLNLVVAEEQAALIGEAVSILNRRLELAGIPGLAEQTSPTRIRVRIPDDPDSLRRAGELLTAGGRLRFCAVVTEKEMPRDEIDATIEQIHARKADGTYDETAATHDVAIWWNDDQKTVLFENPGVEGFYIDTASHVRDDRTPSGYRIGFEFGDEGTQRFFDFTTVNEGRLEAIVLDGVVQTQVTISEPIPGGAAVISRGAEGFTQDEASRIAAILGSGRLPVDLTLEED